MGWARTVPARYRNLLLTLYLLAREALGWVIDTVFYSH